MFVLTHRFLFLKIEWFLKMGSISHPGFKINDSISMVVNDAVNLKVLGNAHCNWPCRLSASQGTGMLS